MNNGECRMENAECRMENAELGGENGELTIDNGLLHAVGMHRSVEKCRFPSLRMP